MFNMDEENDNHIVFASEGWKDSNLFKAEAEWGDYSIEVGNETDQEIKKLNRLIEFINKSSNKEFKNKFNEYLNFEATINYLIIMEFALLDDNVAKNMLLATYDGKVWYPTLYDLDTSWGADYDRLSTRDYNKTDSDLNSKLWSRMIENYPKEISERYFELRNDILTKEHVLELFENFDNKIPSETFEKENVRWQNIPGYDIKQIEEFLDTRIPLMDKIMTERKEKGK